MALGCGACGTSVPSSAVPVSPSPQETPAPSQAFPTCDTSQLDISVTHPQVAAGTVGAWLVFANHGTTPCQLHGWPTLVGMSVGDGSTIARQTDATLTFPKINGVPTVVLQPGDAAVAAFAGSDNPGPSGCLPPYHTLLVAPPGSSALVALSGYNAWLGQDTPACFGLEVTMVIQKGDVDLLQESPAAS